ncbi:MAG: hypothetical protein LH606_10840 [Cytophagaceae bacterium]|nr:hypothetical protein [Cytophagaceae bacterium]
MPEFFKKFLFLTVGLLAGQSAGAQLPDTLYRGRLILKVAPLSAAFDPHQTYQLGVEYFVSQRWSVQQEIGYGRYGLFLHANNGLADRGQQVWRYRAEGRKYRPARSDRLTGQPRAGRPYLAYEFLFKRVHLPQSQSVGRDCDSGMGCAYFEQIDYTNARDAYTLHFKFGKQYIWDRFVLDYYGGIGWRILSIRNLNLPVDAQTNWLRGEERGFWIANIRQPGVYSLPSACLGLKLGILCGKVPRQLRNNAW